MANEAEQAIYNRLASAPTFHPATADIFATDWGLDAGDVVAVQSGNDTYNVPVYNMSLNWKGNSRVQIQSTGNETRKPLSALKRKQFSGGRGAYENEKELQRFHADLVQAESDLGAKIGLVVTETDEGGNVVNAASIVAGINSQDKGSESYVDIQAQYINLTGYVRASEIDADIATIRQLKSESGYTGSLRVTGALSSGTVQASTINGSTVIASTYKIADDPSNVTLGLKSLTLPKSGGGLHTLSALGTGDNITIPNAITALQIVAPTGTSTTYKLQGKSFASSNWTDIGTFERAASKVSGAWSGATYTVSADANGQNLPISATVGLHIYSTWDYDDGLDKYRKTVQIRSGTTVVATDYIDKPDSVISAIALSNSYDTKPSASEYDEDGGLLTAGKYYIVTATADTGGTKKIVLQVPSGEYTEYRVQSSWRSYTPGTSSSSRTLTITAQGKNSDGNWVQIASASRTIRANHYWNDDEQKYETTIT